MLAASSPGDCFTIVLEAFQLAVKYMTPVVVLSDSFLANSAEPWKIPEVDTLPRFEVEFAQENHAERFEPYRRHPETLARPWAIPGTPGLEHRIGGLTNSDLTGDVAYDPENHAHMVELRRLKVARIANDIAPVEIDGPQSGLLLVIGWGGTEGAIIAAVKEAREKGHAVSRIHLRHLNPFPPNLGEVLGRFEKVLVPELNLGQLAMLLRAEYLVDALPFNTVAGQPFKVAEILGAIERTLGED